MNPFEPLPPIFIFDANAKEQDQIKLKPKWLVGLPQVTGRWGFEVNTTVDSHVAVWHHGSMDTELFEQVIEFIVSLCPNVLRKIKCNENGRLLQGLILIKVDGGQGRVSKNYPTFYFDA